MVGPGPGPPPSAGGDNLPQKILGDPFLQVAPPRNLSPSCRKDKAAAAAAAAADAKAKSKVSLTPEEIKLNTKFQVQ